MDVPAQFGNGDEQIVGAADIVVDRVALMRRIGHRIGRGALFGKVHDGIGLEAVDGVAQPGIVIGNVDMEIVDRLAGNAMPGLQALADGGDRCETGRAQFIVDMPAREIVDDTNAIAVG